MVALELMVFQSRVVNGTDFAISPRRSLVRASASSTEAQPVRKSTIERMTELVSSTGPRRASRVFFRHPTKKASSTANMLCV